MGPPSRLGSARRTHQSKQGIRKITETEKKKPRKHSQEVETVSSPPVRPVRTQKRSALNLRLTNDPVLLSYDREGHWKEERQSP